MDFNSEDSATPLDKLHCPHCNRPFDSLRALNGHVTKAHESYSNTQLPPQIQLPRHLGQQYLLLHQASTSREGSVHSNASAEEEDILHVESSQEWQEPEEPPDDDDAERLSPQEEEYHNHEIGAIDLPSEAESNPQDADDLSIAETLYSDSDSLPPMLGQQQWLEDWDEDDSESPPNPTCRREVGEDAGDDGDDEEEEELFHHFPSPATENSYSHLDPLGLFSKPTDNTNTNAPAPDPMKSQDALLVLHERKKKTCAQSSPLSQSHIAAIELMARLHKSNSPLLMYDEMAAWSAKCLPQPERPLLSRKHLLSFLQERYSLESLKPMRKKVYLPSQKITITVTCQNLVAEIFSKLTNPAIFNPESVLFNPQDPCAPIYQSEGDIGDSNTGEVWGMGEEKYCTNPTDQLFSLDMFIDGTPLSQNGTGNLNIEPVSMNFLALKRAIRVRPEAEFRLGYIRDYHAKINPTEELAADTDAKEKANFQTGIMGSIQDYHAILGAVFEDLVSIQERGGLKWNWALLGDGFANQEVMLKMPIEKIRGDTVGHNKLCGVKGRRTCRYCNTPPNKLSTRSAGFQLTQMETVQRMAHSSNTGRKNNYFERNRYHPLKENAFYRIQFCDQKGGIFQCCPGELLHQFQQGMMKYGLAGCFEMKSIPVSEHRVSTFSNSIL